jgi:hypothetical protein
MLREVVSRGSDIEVPCECQCKDGTVQRLCLVALLLQLQLLVLQHLQNKSHKNAKPLSFIPRSKSKNPEKRLKLPNANQSAIRPISDFQQRAIKGRNRHGYKRSKPHSSASWLRLATCRFQLYICGGRSSVLPETEDRKDSRAWRRDKENERAAVVAISSCLVPPSEESANEERRPQGRANCAST